MAGTVCQALDGGGVYLVGHSRGAKISMLQATGDPRVKVRRCRLQLLNPC